MPEKKGVVYNQISGKHIIYYLTPTTSAMDMVEGSGSQ